MLSQRFCLFFVHLLFTCGPIFAADAQVRWIIHDLSRLPDPEVTTVAMDDQGNKWFGTHKGLTRLSKFGDWQSFTVENTSGGLRANFVTALAIGENR